MPGGLNMNKIRNRKWSGTTTGLANAPSASQPVLPKEWDACTDVQAIVNGEYVYIEGADTTRTGFSAPEAEVVFESGDANHICSVTLNDDVKTFAIFYADAGDSNKGKAVFGKVVNGRPVFGPIATIEAGATSSTSICRMSDTKFAVAFADGGDSTKAKCVVCTVNEATLAITAGTAVDVTSAAIDDTGTAICQPIDGVVVVAYALAADHKGYVQASVVTGTTPATFSTADEFRATADVNYPAMCSQAYGYYTIMFQDGGTSNDPLAVNIGTVTAAGVTTVADGTTATDLTGAAATSISVVSPTVNVIVASWIDTGDAHAIAATTSTTTASFGSEISVDAGTCLTPAIGVMDSTHVVYAYEDDADSTLTDPGRVVLITRSGTTLTAGSVIDYITQASTQTLAVASFPDGSAVISYDDAADSNKGTSRFTQYSTRICDVRSGVASAAYTLRLFPIYE